LLLKFLGQAFQAGAGGAAFRTQDPASIMVVPAATSPLASGLKTAGSLGAIMERIIVTVVGQILFAPATEMTIGYVPTES